jgi:hypothetical protein
VNAEQKPLVIFLLITCALAGLCPSGRAETPINELPGVVDANSWQTKSNPPSRPPAQPLPMPSAHAKTYEILQGLNQIPESQLTDKAGQIHTLLEALRAEDGPEYLILRRLLARADIRKELNPGVKGLLAGILSQRWDAFTLAGNLWLAALRSTNVDLQVRARQQLVHFIQPTHVPVLIDLLKTPGPNVLAYEILQEVTGRNIEPTPKLWLSLWNKNRGKIDVVGRVLNQSRLQLRQLHIRPFEESAFWYVPEGVSRANTPYAKRSTDEKNAVGHWADAAKADANWYLDQWAIAKPLFDRIVHQPDPRVGGYLRSLAKDPGFGNYVAVVLAWRGDAASIKLIDDAYAQEPSVGRALALGSMGDKNAVQDLLKMIETRKQPLSFGLMDETLQSHAARLPALGIIPAEQAFELLTHQNFGLSAAVTAGEKRKSYGKALRWLADNFAALKLDRKRGYYVLP